MTDVLMANPYTRLFYTFFVRFPSISAAAG